MNRRQSAYQAAAAPPPAAPDPEPPAPPAPFEDRYEALQRLAELHDSGVLTDAEFEQEKAKILQQG